MSWNPNKPSLDPKKIEELKRKHMEAGVLRGRSFGRVTHTDGGYTPFTNVGGVSTDEQPQQPAPQEEKKKVGRLFEKTIGSGGSATKMYEAPQFRDESGKVSPEYNTNKAQDILSGASAGLESAKGADVYTRLGATIGGALAGVIGKNLGGYLDYRSREAEAKQKTQEQLAQTEAAMKLKRLEDESALRAQRAETARVRAALDQTRLDAAMSEQENTAFLTNLTKLDSHLSSPELFSSDAERKASEEQYKSMVAGYASVGGVTADFSADTLDEVRTWARANILKPAKKAVDIRGVKYRENYAGQMVPVTDATGNVVGEADYQVKVAKARFDYLKSVYKTQMDNADAADVASLWAEAVGMVSAKFPKVQIYNKNGSLNGLGVKAASDVYTGLLAKKYGMPEEMLEDALGISTKTIKATDYAEAFSGQPAKSGSSPEGPKPNVQLANEALRLMPGAVGDTTIESLVRPELQNRLSGLFVKDRNFQSLIEERYLDLEKDMEAVRPVYGRDKQLTKGNPERYAALEKVRKRLGELKKAYADEITPATLDSNKTKWESDYNILVNRVANGVGGESDRQKLQDMLDALSPGQKRPENLHLGGALATPTPWTAEIVGGQLVWKNLVTNPNVISELKTMGVTDKIPYSEALTDNSGRTLVVTRQGESGPYVMVVRKLGTTVKK